MYQHDAACRVIARLLKEKEEYKLLLQQYTDISNNGKDVPNGSSTVTQNGVSSMDIDENTSASTEDKAEDNAIPANVLEELGNKCTQLSTNRKSVNKRNAESSNSKAGISSLKETIDFTCHKNEKLGQITSIVYLDSPDGGMAIYTVYSMYLKDKRY